MAKDRKNGQFTQFGPAVTRPIGAAKAERFSAVEGLKLSQRSKTLSGQLLSNGLSGDAYRAEIAKAFKKG